MDAKDVKPARPSLLSGTDGRTASSATGARILADMEGGSRRRTRTNVRRRRPSWWVLGALAIAVVAGYHFLASPVQVDEAVIAVAPAASPADGIVRPSSLADVDDAAMSEPFDSLSEHADGSSEFPLSPMPDPQMQVNAKAAPVVVAKSTKPSVARAATRKRAQTADSKRTAPSREAPLMASLLNNIEQDQVTPSAARSLPPPQPAASLPPTMVEAPPVARDNGAMDALVKQINDGKTVASAEAGVTRTETVQAAMRRCPRANTRAGLRCREKVCDRFRGLDRACPD